MRRESEETMHMVREAMGLTGLESRPNPTKHSLCAPGAQCLGLIYC